MYAKPAFGGPISALEYLGRYTHKIAISNHRIKETGDGRVRFAFKDYTQQGARKEMELEGMEFIRRFSLHILPKGFVRIRHFGILSSGNKKQHIETIREQLNTVKPVKVILKKLPETEPYNPKRCPHCEKETMVPVLLFRRRDPPVDWKEQAQALLECIK